MACRGESHMKKVACVIPPFYRLIESKNNRVTISMHYLAEILHRRGHEVIYINGDYADDSVSYCDRLSMTKNSWLFGVRYECGHVSYDEVMGVLQEFGPDVVIIGAGDVLMPTVELGSPQSCAYMAKRVRELLRKDIVCVGYGHLLRYASKEETKNLDVIITGEGEEDIANVVENDLRGMLPEKWVSDMDALPILTDSYLYQQYQPEDLDYIMSMRGCGHRCVFCQQPSMRGNRVAMMSSKRFVREVRYRIEQFGTTDFYFSDPVFIPNCSDRTNEMLKMLIHLKKEYPSFMWRSEARIDTIISHSSIAEKMYQSGCRHLKLGVEMLNPDMLAYIKKDIKSQEAIEAFKICRRAGIETTAYVLLGCPGFQDKDYQDMWKHFHDLQANNYVINITVPYQGTELYSEMATYLHQKGLYEDGEEGFSHISLIMKDFWNISDETLAMYFSLQGKKDDANKRSYCEKIVDKEYFDQYGIIRYLSLTGGEI